MNGTDIPQVECRLFGTDSVLLPDHSFGHAVGWFGHLANELRKIFNPSTGLEQLSV